MEKLSAAMEKYLKTIYHMSHDHAVVRVTKIAVQMEVSKASVCQATNLLANKGLIRKDKYRNLSLTPEGLKEAELLANKHKIIQRFLSEILQVDPTIADKDAGNIEHTMSLESLQSMRRYLENYEQKQI